MGNMLKKSNNHLIDRLIVAIPAALCFLLFLLPLFRSVADITRLLSILPNTEKHNAYIGYPSLPTIIVFLCCSLRLLSFLFIGIFLAVDQKARKPFSCFIFLTEASLLLISTLGIYIASFLFFSDVPISDLLASFFNSFSSRSSFLVFLANIFSILFLLLAAALACLQPKNLRFPLAAVPAGIFLILATVTSLCNLVMALTSSFVTLMDILQVFSDLVFYVTLFAISLTSITLAATQKSAPAQPTKEPGTEPPKPEPKLDGISPEDKGALHLLDTQFVQGLISQEFYQDQRNAILKKYLS